MTIDQQQIIDTRIAQSAMMQWLNLSVSFTDGKRSYKLGFDEEHIGNPILRALHGGVISSFLESCALLDAVAQAPEGTQCQFVSIHISYLAPAEATDMICTVTTAKMGRRMAFFEATATQKNTKGPVARAAIAIRLIRRDESSHTTQA